MIILTSENLYVHQAGLVITLNDVKPLDPSSTKYLIQYAHDLDIVYTISIDLSDV